MLKNMQFIGFMRNAFLLGALPVAALFSGCASTGSTEKLGVVPVAVESNPTKLVPTEWVKQRSQARWDFLLAGKFADAYQFLAPGVRAVLPVEAYVKSFGPAGMWTQADVANVVCDQPERCTSNVTVGLRVASPGFTRTPTVGNVPEVWVFEDNNWWIFVQQ